VSSVAFRSIMTFRALAYVITTGLTAGVLFAFACSVMPGLGRTDDRTFISAFQGADAAIVASPPFLAAFVGSPVLTFVALLLHLGEGSRAALGWVIAAFVLTIATIAITRAVHLPLNAAIKAAGDVDAMSDRAEVRERVEGRWVRWNIVRTVTATAALGCLAVALA
jgi:uncharacterized membrane protein